MITSEVRILDDEKIKLYHTIGLSISPVCGKLVKLVTLLLFLLSINLEVDPQA
jgi:hypothetical protein